MSNKRSIDRCTKIHAHLDFDFPGTLSFEFFVVFVFETIVTYLT